MLSYVLIAWPIVSNHGRVLSQAFGVSGQSGLCSSYFLPVAGDLPLAVDHRVEIPRVRILLHQLVVGVAGLDVAVVEEVALGQHEHRVLLDRRMRAALDGLLELLGRRRCTSCRETADRLRRRRSRANCSFGPSPTAVFILSYCTRGSRPGIRPISSVVFAGFDDAFRRDRALNRPAVAVEVAVHAFDLVALAGSNTACFLCFFHHSRRADRRLVANQPLHGQSAEPMAARCDAMHGTIANDEHADSCAGAKSIANRGRQRIRMTAKSWCTRVQSGRPPRRRGRENTRRASAGVKSRGWGCRLSAVSCRPSKRPNVANAR